MIARTISLRATSVIPNCRGVSAMRMAPCSRRRWWPPSARHSTSRCPKACLEWSMLAKGIQLSLLIGPIVPLAVPRVVLDALDSVEVRTAAGSASGFQLKFQINARSPLNTIFLIAAGTNASIATPPLRVMLIVTKNGTPQPLCDGVVTNIDVQAGGGGAPGTLTVTGEDVSKAMDMQDFSG